MGIIELVKVTLFGGPLDGVKVMLGERSIEGGLISIPSSAGSLCLSGDPWRLELSRRTLPDRYYVYRNNGEDWIYEN
jgi:hypothetical protein